MGIYFSIMWDLLSSKLYELEQSGLSLEVWLRDDDIRHASRNFEKLNELVQSLDISIAYSVIPKSLEKNVIRTINSNPKPVVFQHGFDHKNYNIGGENCELVTLNKHPKLVENLLRGKEILKNCFRERFITVMVPPWNRIALSIRNKLIINGYIGLSAFSSYHNTSKKKDLLQLNPQIDLIDWKYGDIFAGDNYCLKQIIHFLEQYLKGKIRQQPLGLMSHHRTMGESGFRFIKQFSEFIKKWANIRQLNINTFFLNKD